jgi:hypothetical protein
MYSYFMCNAFGCIESANAWAYGLVHGVYTGWGFW